MFEYLHYALGGRLSGSEESHLVVGIWNYKNGEMVFGTEGKIAKREFVPVEFPDIDQVIRAMKPRMDDFFVAAHGAPESIWESKSVFATSNPSC